jgi:hypothetical protein
MRRVYQRCSNLVEEQYHFTGMIDSCWKEFGPSRRYFKALIRHHVDGLEKEEGVVVESDVLMSRVLKYFQRKTF